MVLLCNLNRMSIRIFEKYGRIQDLDIDDVMGSEFD